MRIEIAGAQITDRVVDVLEALQDHDGCAGLYISAIDRVTQSLILDDSCTTQDDSEILSHLRALQMLRRDILTLSSPPDKDLPENDTPELSI